MSDRVYVRVPESSSGARTYSYVPLTEDIVAGQSALLATTQPDPLDVARGVATLNAEARIFGSHVPAWQYDPVPSWANVRGARLEEAVGTTANLLAYEFPGAYVLHSVSLDSRNLGEVDTVVIYRGRVILVEAKHVSPGQEFYFGEQGSIRVRRRSQNHGGMISSLWRGDNLGKKIALFQEQYPDLVVEGMYVFAGTQHVKREKFGTRTILPFELLYSALTARLRRELKSADEMMRRRQEQTDALLYQLRQSRTDHFYYTRHATALIEEGHVFPKVIRKAWSFRNRLRQTWKVWTR